MNKRQARFTLIELLVVMAIIIILASLVLGISGYVQKKGARSRAEAEIAAISAACESYKADNGTYPTDSICHRKCQSHGVTSSDDREQIPVWGTRRRTGTATASLDSGLKSYFTFKPNMLLPAPPSTSQITAIRDPFGNAYGYSTAKRCQTEPRHRLQSYL